MTFQNDALMIIAEIICCKIFFETFADKKEDKPFYTPYVILAYLGVILYALSNWLAEHFIIKEYMMIMATAILMFAYLDITLMKSLILAFLFQSLILVVDYGGVAFVLLFLSDYKPMIHVWLGLISIVCKLCSFFIILIIHRIVKKRKGNHLQPADLAKFAVFPFFSMLMAAAVIATYQYAENPQQMNILIVIAIVQFGANIFMYYLLSNLLKRERKIQDEKLFMLEVRSQMNMYQTISENYDTQRKKTHEFKNQILCIEGLLHQKEYKKAEAYVKGISGSFSQKTNTIHTNHAIIDAVINTKYKEAEEKQIVFVVKVNDLSAIPLEDTDTVVILSNLLDNAIEAAEKCEKDRIVKLKFVAEEDIILSVKNTYAQKPHIVDGTFVTNKPEKAIHGIGIRNIMDTVKKYGGSCTIKDAENEFLFSIYIPKESD